MKNLFLVLILALLVPSNARADTSCKWTASKQGVTIEFVADCNANNQSLVDNTLNEVLSRINRPDTSLKILALVDFGRLSYASESYDGFFSIGYDTLSTFDDDFIFRYYSREENISMDKNNGVNKFDSKAAPLDINAGNKKIKNEIGIKIIYDHERKNGKNWQYLINAIVYAEKNSGEIKYSQKREIVRYNTNGWYISLVTIDTFAINKITGKRNVTRPTQPATVDRSLSNKRKWWLFSGGIVLLILLVARFGKRRQK